MPYQDTPTDSPYPKEVNIEKFEFDKLEKEPIPFVQLRTEVVETIQNSQAFHVWCYLQAKPVTWVPNKYQIMKHFGFKERTYKSIMSYLSRVGLIEYRQERFADGTLGSTFMVVLNGSKYCKLLKAQNDEDLNVGSNGSNEPVQMVQMVEPVHRSAKICTAVETKAQQGFLMVHEPVQKLVQPECKKTGVRLNCTAYINKHIQHTNKQKTYTSISSEMNEPENVIPFEKPKPQDVASEKFEQFWDAYPRKQKKKNALKIWNRNNLEKYFDAIMENLAQRLHSGLWNKKTLRFIPLPDSYLNGERWNDDIKLEAESGDKATFMPSRTKSDYPKNRTFFDQYVQNNTINQRSIDDPEVLARREVEHNFTESELETIKSYQHAVKLDVLQIHFPDDAKREQARALSIRAKDLYKKALGSVPTRHNQTTPMQQMLKEATKHMRVTQ